MAPLNTLLFCAFVCGPRFQRPLAYAPEHLEKDPGHFEKNPGHFEKDRGHLPPEKGLVTPLHGKYLCLEEFNKQQIEEVRSKIRAEKSETRATPKRVWINFIHSASVAFL